MLRFIVLLIIVVICSYCKLSDSNTNTAHAFKEQVRYPQYFNTDEHWPLYQSADSLKWNREYKATVVSLIAVLQKPEAQDSAALCYGWNQLTHCYLMLDSFEKAATVLNQIEAYFQDTKPAQGILADYYFNKGIYFQKTEQGPESIRYLKKALELFQELYPKPHPYPMWALAELALSFKQFTFSVDSFLHYSDQAYALLVRDSQLHFQAPNVYYAKAESCWKRRAHVEGENMCDVAINAARECKTVDTIFVAKCLGLKGRYIKKQKGRMLEAEENIRRAIELSEAKGQEPFRNQHLYKELLKYYARQADSINFFSTLEKVEQTIPAEKMQAVQPLSHRGMYAYKNDQIEESIDYYEQFLAQYLGSSGRESALVEEAYFLLIKSYRTLKQFDLAERYVWETIAFRLGLDVKTLTWQDLFKKENASQLHIAVGYHWLAEIYRENYEEGTGDIVTLQRSNRMYQFIDSLIYERMDSYDEDAWLSANRMFNTKIYQSALATAFHSYTLGNNDDDLSWMHHYMERMKSALLFRELLEGLSSSTDSPPDHLLQKEKELNQQIRSLKQQRNKKDALVFSRFLQAEKELNEQLANKYPLYYQAKIKHPFLDNAEVQQALATTNDALINYTIANNHLYIFFANADTALCYRNAWTAEQEQELNWLKAYLAGEHNIFSQKNIIKYKQLAFHNYQQLIGPISDLFNPGQRLIIIPDGAIHGLAFDALLTRLVGEEQSDFSKLPYLLKSQKITYAFSAKNCLHQQTIADPLTKPSILGYAFSKSEKPIAGLLRSQAKIAIPGTGAELGAIDRFLPNGKKSLHYGAEASLDHFIEASREPYDIFHFALHARSDPNDRLNNVIYFPGNPVDSIFGYELIALQLKGKLAVLASCETATGVVEAGEGIYSLSRSLLLSGVERVISSLWEIDDQATSDIVSLFYQQLGARLLVHHALWQAKLTYLEGSTNYRSHPYYWSGLSYWGA